MGVTDVHRGKSKDTKVTWEYVMKGMLSVLRMEMRAGEELLERTLDIPERTRVQKQQGDWRGDAHTLRTWWHNGLCSKSNREPP